MWISVLVFFVGFLTAYAAVAEKQISVNETETNNGTKVIHDQETTTFPTFNEPQIELAKQGPINNDTKPKIREDEILFTINENHKQLVKQFQLVNGGLLSDDYFRSDNFVFGLLSRNKWNIPAAIKALKRIFLWRRSNRIDELGAKEADPELLKLFPYQVTAVDRNGCPVLESFVGKWLVADYMESKEFVRDAIKSFEAYITQALEKTRTANKNVLAKCNQATIFLLDASGFSTKNIAEPNTISVIVRFATFVDNYFPNLFKTLIPVNVNPDFAKLIDTLIPFFGQTAMKIKPFKDNETEQAKDFVYKLIDPEQLSHKYFDVQSLK